MPALQSECSIHLQETPVFRGVILGWVKGVRSYFAGLASHNRHSNCYYHHQFSSIDPPPPPPPNKNKNKQTTTTKIKLPEGLALRVGCFRTNPSVALCRGEGRNMNPKAGRFGDASLSSSSSSGVCFGRGR